MTSVRISPATFAAAFHRLERDIAAFTPVRQEFSFQSGLPYDWEHYKEWVYYEAQRQLDWGSWKTSMIGSGEIVERAISAIEINQGKNHRNNIVAWDGRHGGEKSKSHLKLLLAKTDPTLRKKTESALYRMYVEDADPEGCFGQLTELFGARYDLISYLFFIRDWQKFLPARPSVFPKAFDELGVPLKMSLCCKWENYAGFLARMREVQRHLAGYDLPGGARFVDAHSFCWMLASEHLRSSLKAQKAQVSVIAPKASAKAGTNGAGVDGYTQEDLDTALIARKWIGDLAQAVVLHQERQRLKNEGRADLANCVEDVSHNLSLGYDIASFTSDGAAKPIEVKATAIRGGDLRFFLSENERARSRSVANYTFALVLDVQSPKPTILEFAGNMLPPESLRSITYEVRLENPMETAKRA